MENHLERRRTSFIAVPRHPVEYAWCGFCVDHLSKHALAGFMVVCILYVYVCLRVCVSVCLCVWSSSYDQFLSATKWWRGFELCVSAVGQLWYNGNWADGYSFHIQQSASVNQWMPVKLAYSPEQNRVFSRQDNGGNINSAKVTHVNTIKDVVFAAWNGVAGDISVVDL